MVVLGTSSLTVLHDRISREAELGLGSRIATRCKPRSIYSHVFEPILDSVMWKRSTTRAA